MKTPIALSGRRTIRLAPLVGLLVAVLISACGGGGGSSDDGTGGKENGNGTTPPTGTDTDTTTPLSAAQLQGRWLTATGISPARTGIVLPTGAGGFELWLLSADLSSLARLQIATIGTDAVSANGKIYSLPSTSANIGQAASYSGTANLTNNSLSLNAGALLLTRSDAFTAPSSLNDVTGNWRASVGDQTVTLAWSLAANGAISGPSSTGCSYSGTLSARSDASAYNANLTETCSNGSVTFSGIATYRASPVALTLAMTSTDATQTKALVLSMTRP